MDVLDLKATLGLDTSKYDSGLRGAESKAGSFGGKLSKGLGTAAKVGAATVAAVGTAATAAGVAFTNATGEVAEYGDNIDKTSQKLGLSSTAYQEWDAVLQHSGTSMAAMKPAMKTLSKAAESGSDAFQKLGLSQEEVASMSKEELFNATITGLQNVSDEGERSALATELLGKGAVEMGALLNTSAEDTQKMKDRVHELGGVMSEDAVKASASYQDSLQDLKTAMDGTKRNAIAQFLPSMTQVMDGLTAIFAGEEGGAEKIKKGIDGIFTKVKEIVPSLAEKAKGIAKSIFESVMENIPSIIGGTVRFLIQGIQGLVSALPKMIEAAVKILSSVMKAVMGALPDLMKTLGTAIAEGLPKLVEAGLKLIKDFAESLSKNGGEMATSGTSIVGGVIQGVISCIPILLEYVPQIIVALIKAFVTNVPALISKLTEILLTGIGQILIEVFNAVTTGLSPIKDKVVEAFGHVLDGIKEFFTDAYNTVKEKIVGVKNGIVDGFKSAKDKIVEVLGTIKSKLSGAWDKIKETASTAWENIKDVITLPYKGAKAVLEKVTDTIKNILPDAWDKIKEKASSVWESVKDAITDPIENAKDKVKEIIDKIKDFFDFDFELPHIKLPHISVSPAGWSIGDIFDGVIPSLGIDWYKKAYNTPYMFTKPTVVNGKGFGDGNGGEMVYGHDALMDDIRNAAGDNGMDITINIYATDRQDEKLIADEVQKQFVRYAKQRKAAFA